MQRRGLVWSRTHEKKRLSVRNIIKNTNRLDHSFCNVPNTYRRHPGILGAIERLGSHWKYPDHLCAAESPATEQPKPKSDSDLMPVMLAPAVVVVWLHPDVTDAQELTPLLHPYYLDNVTFHEWSAGPSETV